MSWRAWMCEGGGLVDAFPGRQKAHLQRHDGHGSLRVRVRVEGLGQLRHAVRHAACLGQVGVRVRVRVR